MFDYIPTYTALVHRLKGTGYTTVAHKVNSFNKQHEKVGLFMYCEKQLCSILETIKKEKPVNKKTKYFRGWYPEPLLYAYRIWSYYK